MTRRGWPGHSIFERLTTAIETEEYERSEAAPTPPSQAPPPPGEICRAEDVGKPPPNAPDVGSEVPGHPAPPEPPQEQRTFPHDGVVELDTAAPLIGKLLDAPPPILAAAAAYRPASFLADAVTIGDFHVAAASHIGMSHAAQGGPRQDSYNFVLTSTGRLVTAIADGMGSRSASQIGSDQFCADVVLAAASNPDATAAEYLRLASTRTTEVVRAMYHMEPDAVSFVAAVAVINGTSCEVARVGDVSAFAIDASGEFTELYPVDDAHVNVVGAALPDPEAEPELVALAAPRRLVLATDGLAGDLRRSVAVREWLGLVWAGRPTAHAMSDGLRYRRRGSHDDRTAIVVAVPPAHSEVALPGEDPVPTHEQAAATDGQGAAGGSQQHLREHES